MSFLATPDTHLTVPNLLSSPPAGDHFDRVLGPFEYGCWLIRIEVGSAGPVLVNRPILMDCNFTLCGSFAMES